MVPSGLNGTDRYTIRIEERRPDNSTKQEYEPFILTQRWVLY
ncbi:MAG TPA: hypothetical protein PLG17_04960 [Thermodesulfobacteriota bacterium]|nr:hypothetical protein [Thermodesulfobacteriota bacterium]HNU70263.1 hypothetical protein [Thermodesulfobacteriota bacterium]HQO77845.1 hypothetical protein [Thermodesulfobacteriota bacterium]